MSKSSSMNGNPSYSRTILFAIVLCFLLLLVLWPHYETPLESLSFASTSHQASCRVYDNLKHPLTKEYGRTNLMLSRSYEGSGMRVRKLLRKAQLGKPIKIAVIGGSVSAGHAIAIPFTWENYMYPRIQHWLQETFKQTQFDLDTDGAIPAQTNIYFSYCMNEHVPQDADLVFIELDINANPLNEESVAATEAVVRSALALPSQPAVIYVSIFALSFDNLVHGWLAGLPASVFLDVPHINIRNFLLPHLMQHPEDIPKWFSNWASDIDLRHINAKAHVATGDMVIAYLEEQLCVLDRHGVISGAPHNEFWPSNNITKYQPRLAIMDGWSATATRPPFHPRCRAINSKYDPLVPKANHGWMNVTHNGKMSFEATKEGSSITFDFDAAAGVAGIWFWATKDPAFGAVECHVDDDTAADRLRWVEGYWPYKDGATFDWSRDLWTDLEPGKHTLTCKLIRGMFRISATITR